MNYIDNVIQVNWNSRKRGEFMTVSKNIKVYLIEHNITQKWLSKETGIDKEKLNLSLNDNRKLDVEEFAKIIVALNVSADTFIKTN